MFAVDKKYSKFILLESEWSEQEIDLVIFIWNLKMKVLWSQAHSNVLKNARGMQF